MSTPDRPGEWVLLAYRIPREPSTPRIAIWRALKRLGVAQLGDGLVGLPADARTREHLDWIAQQAVDAAGTATVWLARPVAASQERQIAAVMAAERAKEYAKVRDEATAALDDDDAARITTMRKLRAELDRIGKRDYFPPAERDAAHTAVTALTGDLQRQVRAS